MGSPLPDFEAAHRALVEINCGYSDVSDRVAVSRAALDARSTAGFMTLGQSQTANAGETCFAPDGHVFNLNPFDGKLYRARDPLLGCNEERGNFAGRMGHLLVSGGRWADVVILPIGVCGTAIAEWVPDGHLHHRIVAAVGCLRAAGLVPTAVLWGQGEADAVPGADGERYRASLLRIVGAMRALGIAAPVHVAVSTFCNTTSDGNAAIRAAQRSIVSPADGIFAGPDTDRLGIAYRFDNCHFSDEGLWAVARMWVDAIEAARKSD